MYNESIIKLLRNSHSLGCKLAITFAFVMTTNCNKGTLQENHVRMCMQKRIEEPEIR